MSRTIYAVESNYEDFDLHSDVLLLFEREEDAYDYLSRTRVYDKTVEGTVFFHEIWDDSDYYYTVREYELRGPDEVAPTRDDMLSYELEQKRQDIEDADPERIDYL